MGPSILFRLSPGTIVTVQFDATTLTGASFQGIQGNTALFRVGALIHHVVLRRINDIAF